ncbi:MAG TPA: hypothetical protein VNB64_14080, partial [Solirubrobacteraceae bacterium]|nr:hypothetical protein [Solirubrobacteraceae bacterium]
MAASLAGSTAALAGGGDPPVSSALPERPVAEVPAVSLRPDRVSGPLFAPWGSPDAGPLDALAGGEIASIAAAPGGGSAWAVGTARSGELGLHRFDGAGWRRCDPGASDGDNGACAGLRPLRDRGLVLKSIATVPRADGDFEAVAVGWTPAPAGQPADRVAPAIVRYRDGRWTEDEAPSDAGVQMRYRLRNVAFTGPDAGWAYGASAWDPLDAVILRFRDGAWRTCGPRECERDGELPDNPFHPASIGRALVPAGGRVFLAGMRVKNTAKLGRTYHPVIVKLPEDPSDPVAGLDPAGLGGSAGPMDEGRITSIAVGESPDGKLDGWARAAPSDGEFSDRTLRLAPNGEWRPWKPSARGDELHDRVGAEVVGMVPRADGGSEAIMSTSDRVLRFDAAEERWRVLPTPFDPSGANPFTAGELQAIAPDGAGGMWLVQGSDRGPFFHRLSDRHPRPVFDDVAHPFAGGRIRHLAGAADGAVWLAGDDGRFARYDRQAGWSTDRIEGWGEDSAVTVVAAGPDGTGVAGGEGGQIASLDRGGGRVESCDCGVDARRAAAVAPDGSALVGGDGPSMVWRPAGQRFRTVRAPPSDSRVTGVALPANDRAWATTADGHVFAGRRAGADWTWTRESREDEEATALRAVAVDASGRGYAVGDGGTVLERSGGTWRRLALGVSDEFTTVALPGAGDGALIGAELGAVWTRVGGRFELARPANPVDGYAGFAGSRVSGLALLPGAEGAGAEAWAALDGPEGTSALLHYASDPADPVEPLPDAPPARPGELSFVAFGKSDCANPSERTCPGPSGTDALNDVVARRVTDAVTSSEDRPASPAFAVFTGDASDHGGNVARAARPTMLHEWVDLVARPLDEAGVPVLGAIGVRDLSDATQCADGREACVSSAQATDAGANVFWRQAMAQRVGQDGGPDEFGGLEYRPVEEGDVGPTPDVEVGGTSVPTGGARTHYAVDVLRGADPLLRLVFVDNSLGSLRASDPLQQPPEPRGQLAWLDRVLGSRPEGAGAVVVATSPSYAYRPETAAEAADDGASFEEVVLRHRVSAVVSGRLGWNGLYYALAPGVHCPGPGGAYPERPPSGAGDCGRSSPLPADVPPASGASRSPVPFVISSSAGGKLADGAGHGFWHGYSVVRLDASGDPAKTIVEQRPILDWLVVTADRRRLRPGDKLTLKGVGREPVAADTPPRYHRLTGPSITHRYDLLVADPEKPWLPYRDDDGDYVALSERHPDCSVGCVDRQSGEVTAGEGTDEPVDAVGVLSAGPHAATYPLRFGPRAAKAAASPAA